MTRWWRQSDRVQHYLHTATDHVQLDKLIQREFCQVADGELERAALVAESMGRLDITEIRSLKRGAKPI